MPGTGFQDRPREFLVIARIGIADTGREIEVEFEDRDEFVNQIENAYESGRALLWFRNAQGHEFCVPRSHVAFVELVESPDKAVGFSR